MASAPLPLDSAVALQTFTNRATNQKVLLIDNNRGEIKVFLPDIEKDEKSPLRVLSPGEKSKPYNSHNKKHIGELHYDLERESGTKIYVLTFIQVQPAYQKLRLAPLLMYHLAMRALKENCPIIRVNKPAQTVQPFYVKTGFDIDQAKKDYAEELKKNPGYSSVSINWEDLTPPQADGSSARIMRINEAIAKEQWDLGTPALPAS